MVFMGMGLDIYEVVAVKGAAATMVLSCLGDVMQSFVVIALDGRS